MLTEDTPAPELHDDGPSRKRFLAMVGGSGAAAALATLLSACGGGVDSPEKAPKASADTRRRGTDQRGDLGVVAYALMLEHTESAFYRRVVEADVVKHGRGRSLLQRIDANERRHVEVLTDALRSLGGTPERPTDMNFDRIIESGPAAVLRTSATLENVGAAAYLGQAHLISSPEVLSTALGIHTVEARQAAALNDLVGRGFDPRGDFAGSVPNGAFAKPLSRAQALRQIRSLLGA